MNKKENDYKYVMLPTYLMNRLDVNCRSVLYTLIQLSGFYAKDDGYFYRCNSDLQQQCGLSLNVLNAALDALYINKIVDIVPVAKGKGKACVGRKYKVNFDSFTLSEEYQIEDTIKNPEFQISTVKYKGTYTPSFQKSE